MKSLNALLIIATMLAGVAHAAAPTGTPTGVEAAKPIATATNSSDMTVGEIKKIDLSNSKVTIKHGEIKNLDMPGMTMVFQVKDPAMLEKLKVGDKMKFKAVSEAGKMIVTDIAPAP